MGNLLIKNCIHYMNSEIVDILIIDGKIKEIVPNQTPQDNFKILNAENRFVTPGFIDMHIHGAGGCDVQDHNELSLKTISETLTKFGITGFLATTLIAPRINNKHLSNVNNVMEKNLGGARLLGLYLEGPFINEKKRGGITSDLIKEPSKKLCKDILDISGGALKIMTIAPELKNISSIINLLQNAGCLVAFGHSDATYNETKSCFEKGVDHITHICNGMAGINHRHPGPVMAVFESDTVTVEIISDGVHLHPSMVEHIYKNIGIDRCICISDGIQGMGLEDGVYKYNNRNYVSKNGTARYEDGTLIGSTLDVFEIAKRFMQYTGCSFQEMIKTITINPAKRLGIDDKTGSINIGKDGDLVLLNKDLSVSSTIINGKVLYQKRH